MLRPPLWKIILVLSICIASLFCALPTFFTNSKYLPNTAVNLGLDLKGGASLVLEVNFAQYYKEQLQNIADTLKKELNKANLKVQNINVESTSTGVQDFGRYVIKIELRDSRNTGNIDINSMQETRKKIRKIAANLLNNGEVEVGLQQENEKEQQQQQAEQQQQQAEQQDKILQKDGSSSIKHGANGVEEREARVGEIKLKDDSSRRNMGQKFFILLPNSIVEEAKDNLLSQSLEIVRRRIDESGTKEIDLQRQGRDQILLQVPGIYDTTEIRSLLGQTAKLSFHFALPEVDVMFGERVPLGAKAILIAESHSARSDEKEKNTSNKFAENTKQKNTEKSDSKDSSEKTGIGRAAPKARFVAVRIKPAMTGDMLLDARASMYEGKNVVNFRLTNMGARIFADLTSKNVGKVLAIVLDDKVISLPGINEPILNGSGVISGSFTGQSANELAILLRAGALPAPLKIVEERTVGPTLGQDSITSGIHAIAIASVMVAIFMVLFYSFWGLFANFALIFNIIMILAVLGVMGATLTLPGLAGIALTLGMAVDANILIYERIREENKRGGAIISAIEGGYKRSFTTIIDSNFTTIAAAAVLYIFGTGPIKGFAITLTVGILCSLFTSISITKLLVALWYRLVKPSKLGL
jgi:preprotein translocase subunit SecD